VFFYVMQADGFGQDPIDLHECRLFEGSSPQVGDVLPEFSEFYYHEWKNIWIKFTECSFEGYKQYYEEIQPDEVARFMILNRRGLPHYLESYREIASDRKSYGEWLKYSREDFDKRRRHAIKPPENHQSIKSFPTPSRSEGRNHVNGAPSGVDNSSSDLRV
jgi:hypothetical protein